MVAAALVIVWAAGLAGQSPAASGQAAQKPSVEALLGQALQQEEVEGNLRAAIASYQKVIAAPGVTRAQAARAQLRIGACCERLGADDARKAYETVLAKYGDQEAAVREARARLAAMGGAAAVAPTAGGGPNLRMLWSKLNWWGARISPDGKQVAFIDMATANLWVRDVATRAGRNLTSTPKEKAWIDFPLHFSWSHDGTRLAYDWYADGGATTEIRVVDVATGGQSSLFTPSFRPGSSAPPTWSGDSRTVFRDGRFEPSMRTIFRVDVQTGTGEPVFPPFKTDSRAPGDQPSTMIGVSATRPNQEEWLLENFLPPAKAASAAKTPKPAKK
jgi:hypothetical protein